MPVSKFLLFASGVKLKTKGAHHIKDMKDESYIIVCNHVTTMDVPVLMVGLNKHDIRYVYSIQATDRIPIIGKFVGFAFQILGWISVKYNETDNTNTLKRIINAARQDIKSRGKFHFAIFPEGIRSEDGKINKFEIGAFYLAIILQVPIIPVMTKGVFAVHRYKTFKVNPGEVGVEVLEPIIPAKVSKGEIRREARKLHAKVAEYYKQRPDLNLNPSSSPHADINNSYAGN